MARTQRVLAEAPSGISHGPEGERASRNSSPSDYVKDEFRDKASGESEWMWVVVNSCDDGASVIFGRLDNEPLLDKTLPLGDELAVGYDKVVEQRKA